MRTAKNSIEIDKSTDYGVSWTLVSANVGYAMVAGQPSGAASDIAFDGRNPSGLYVGGNGSCGATGATLCTLPRSTDGGKTWQITGPPGSFGNIVIDARNGDIFAGGVLTANGKISGIVVKSSDAGKTWTTYGNGFRTHGALVHLDPESPSILYATQWSTTLDINSAAGGVFVSTDRGQSWTLNPVLSQTPADPSNGYVVALEAVSDKNAPPPTPAVDPKAPAISSVVNAARSPGQGLTTGIAEGARFAVIGTGLGPADLVVAENPFQTTAVGGTSVKVTVNGRTVDVPMYSASAEKVIGLLPSTTPIGSGTVTVMFNGVTSAPSPIAVVQSNFGVFTTDQTGTGEAVLTFADGSPVSGSQAANPGETVTLRGTGLGPVTANETAGPLPGDMPDLPVQVWLGVVPAEVLYRGRSDCCIGEDKIVFTVPAGVTGCEVPLAVQINDQVSNVTTMAVAAEGRTCVPQPLMLPPDLLQQLGGQSTSTTGSVTLTRSSTVRVDGSTITTDLGNALFSKQGIPAEVFLRAAYMPLAPYNSCVVHSGSPSRPPSTPPTGAIPAMPDAGPSLAVTGPNGERTINRLTLLPGSYLYTGVFGDGTPGNYLDAGQYTVTSPGGPDVGAFSASIDVPSPAFVVTSSPASLVAVDRPQGLTITWMGGAPDTAVSFSGYSAVVAGGTAVAGDFTCYAHAEAGQFTIPPYVLLSLPASGKNGETTIPGVLAVSTYTLSTFTASGLDVGVIASGVALTAIAVYR